MNRDLQNINSIRRIAIDMTEKSKVGLPYFTFDFAPFMYHLFKNHIKFNPESPRWIDRDRFIFGEINSSTPLLYSTLHHFGYEISIDELKMFYKEDSQVPFFPNVNKTFGVDVTACPSGEELAQATGMALAEIKLARQLNKKQRKVIDHYTYVVMSPESFHEGISYEALSLAGAKKLSKLIIINAHSLITDSDKHKNIFNEDWKLKCRSQGIQYLEVNGANDFDGLDEAITKAKKSKRPSFIDVKVNKDLELNCKGTNAVCYHAIYKKEDLFKLKKYCNHNGETFIVKSDILESFSKIIKDKKSIYQEWKTQNNKILESKLYKTIVNPDYHIDLTKYFDTKIGDNLLIMPNHKGYFSNKAPKSDTRTINLHEKLWDLYPSITGGLIHLWDKEIFENSNMNYNYWQKRNNVYGLREFAMVAATTGMQLHGGIKASCNIPMPFLDYAIPGIKMAAIEQAPALFVITNNNSSMKYGAFTQVIEQLPWLRSIPDLNVFYPSDVYETLLAYNVYLKETNKPTVIIVQSKPVKTISNIEQSLFEKGAYIIKKEKVSSNFKTIVASGPEVHLALKIAQGKDEIRVVSMPSIIRFRKQTNEFKKSIIPDRNKTLFIEISNDFRPYEFAAKVFGIRSNAYSNWSQTSTIINTDELFSKISNIIEKL